MNSVMDQIMQKYKESELKFMDQDIAKDLNYMTNDNNSKETKPVTVRNNEIDVTKFRNSKEEFGSDENLVKVSKVKEEIEQTECVKEECNIKKKIVLDLKEDFEHIKYKHIHDKGVKVEADDTKDDIDIKYHSLECKNYESDIPFTSAVGNDVVSSMHTTRRRTSAIDMFKTTFEKRKKMKKENSNYMCSICSVEFCKIRMLKKHLNTFHGGSKTRCAECNKIFSSKHYLTKHVKSMHWGVKKKCPLCSKEISCNYYPIHLKSHIGFRKFVCSECGSVFSRKSHLETHLTSVHASTKNFVCDQCGRMFTEVRSLNRHLDTVHKGVKKFNCGQCRKVYSSKVELKRHINGVHVGNTSYVCAECGKIFSQRGYLAKHLKARHEKVEKYECTQCRKVFLEKSKLKRHVTQSKKHGNI